jgi:hypothetical protein
MMKKYEPTFRHDELISEIILELDPDTTLALSASLVADIWMTRTDPGNVSTPDVAAEAYLNVKQRARAMLRQKDQDERDRVEQQDMFGASLQSRYPTRRGGEEFYAPRLGIPGVRMTYGERIGFINRMRREVEGKSRHIRALESETETLCAEGYFTQEELAPCGDATQAA